MTGSQGNERLRELREERGLSQEELVRELLACGEGLHRQGRLARSYDISDRQVRRWEREDPPPWPRPDSQTVLETVFGRPIECLGFVRPGTGGKSTADVSPRTHSAPDPAGDPTNRRDALHLGATALAAGAETIRSYTRQTTASDISRADIEALETAVHHVGDSYAARPPGELWPLVGAYRHHAQSLLGVRHTLREGRDLAHQAGMLSVILAWTAHDMGRHDLVAALCADAWHLGDQARSPEVCAWAEDVRATDALYGDRPATALAAAARGLALAPNGGNAAIRLSAQLARAHARLGNAEAFADAAAQARHHQDRVPLHGVGLFAVDAVRILSYDAASYGWLGDHRRARAAASEAIAHYRSAPVPHRAPTRLALAELDLALAHAALGDPDAAVDTARRALYGTRLVHAVRGRVRQLRARLAIHYPTLPQVAEFGEEVRARCGTGD